MTSVDTDLSSAASPVTAVRRPHQSPVLRKQVAGFFVALTMATGSMAAGGLSTTAATAATVTQSVATNAGVGAPAATTALVSSAPNGANPGTCPTSNATSFAKTKFVLHAGLAFGAFHRYLYKPFRAGTFSKGAHGRILAIIKAVGAAVFIEHEVRLTAQDVQANPTLCHYIAAPLKSFFGSISGAVSRLRGGDTSGVKAAQGSLAAVESGAGRKGTAITENSNPNLAA